MQGANLKSSFYKQTTLAFFLSLIFTRMNFNQRILVVDAGNTALKYAVFEGNTITEYGRIEKDNSKKLKDIFDHNNCSALAISSVRSFDFTKGLIETIEAKIHFELNSLAKLPFKLNYLNPEKLGKDRLCNVAAVFTLMKTDYGLVVDIGTCIKFDLIGRKEGYLGGSISPGIQLRYNALNDYTDNLPRLTEKKEIIRTGNSTETSIISGVMFGTLCEINQMIAHYDQQYPSLTIFVTGGDSANFELVSKNDIFAHENLTLIGLYQLYNNQN